MTETIVLDPTAVATGRTQLDITGWVAAAGVDWGDAAIQAYMADQAVGSSTVDYRLPNRTIKIPLSLRTVGATSFSTIRTNLQHKVALMQRKNGWVMRQVGSTALYADVVNATLHLGGSWLQAYRDADVDATLELECLPDWYGDEVTLSDHAEMTLPHLFFTETSINGNYPGRVRLIVDNDQATDQHGLLWGFRASHYDGGTTAALFYEAEALTPVNSAAGSALAGASGGTVVAHHALPASTWASILSTGMISGNVPLTHTGSYRVWARAYSETARPQLRFQWGAGALSVPSVNDPVQLAGTAGFYLMDLGAIRIDPPPTGNSQWSGVVQANVSAANDPVSIDALWFQPLDDGAGKLVYTPVPPVSSLWTLGAGGLYVGGTTATNDAWVGTVDWTNPTNALVYDTSYASVTLTGGQVAKALKITGFGFNIPTGATIKGIQVDTFFQTALGDSSSGGWNWHLVKGGTVQTGSYASTDHLPGTYGPDYYTILGGPTDLWNVAWTASDINSSGFGVSWQVRNDTGSTTFLANFFRIAITYTLASGFTVAQDAVVYASSTAELRTDGMFRKISGANIYGPETNVTGDLPRIPPSGLEGGTIQTFLKLTRGNFAAEPDAGIDDLSCQIKYRPSYIFTP